MNIYLSNETNFNNNGLGFLTDTISAIVHDELNGDYSLKFEYMLDGHLSEYLVRENIIKCPVADGTQQLFRIVNVTKTYEKIKVTALHIFYDLLNNFLEDVYPKNKSGQTFLEHILNNTNFQTNFTAYSDITNTRSARYVKKNPVEVIIGDIDNSMVNLFGGELKRNNFTINFLSRVGEDKGVRLLYGKNITGINISVDITEMATRVMPQGFDGLTLPELYVDSPLINNYPTPKILKMDFSDIIYDPNSEEAYHDIQDAYQALRDRVNEQYSLGLDKPKVNISVDWVELSKTNEYQQYSYLETVRLGDTIYADILDIVYTARVISIDYDVLLDRTTKFQIGTFVPTIASELKQIERSVQQINPSSILQAAQENATQLITTAMGGYVYKTQSELYIMDNPDPALAQKVWRWNINGLGYSSTGINGTYGIAMTMDGAIVADFITTGTLNTSVIQGYDSLTLQVQTNTNDIDTLEQEISSISLPTIEAQTETAYISDTELQNITTSYPLKLEVNPINEDIKSDYEIEGNTTQNGTPTPTNPVSVENVTGEQEVVICGKQLLIFPYNDMTISQNGVDYVANQDGSVLCNGTPTGISYIRLEKNMPILPNTTYTISGIDSSINLVYYIAEYDDNNTRVNSRDQIQGNYTFTTTSSTTNVLIQLKRKNNNVAINNVVIHPMLEKGSTATSYEPYQGKTYNVNLGTIELCKIGNYQDFIKKSTGKNLFDKTDSITNGKTYTNTGETTSLVNAFIQNTYIPVLSSTAYTMSTINNYSSTTDYRLVICEYDENKTFIKRNLGGSTVGNKYTITTSSITKYVRLCATISTKNELQFEKSNSNTSYEPYGKVWYIKKAIGKVVLDGDENWTYQSQFPRFTYAYSDNLMITDSQLYCTHYVKGQTANTNNVISTWAGTSSGQILIHDERFTTKETFNTWLLSNNVSIYGILKTPQYEVITDDELVSQLEAVYYATRQVIFRNTTTDEEFIYTIPIDLLYYDTDTYDSLVADYEDGSITITKKVGYNSLGEKIILPTPEIITYDYDNLDINLTKGNYEIDLLGHLSGFLYVKLMIENIYSAQYATRVEMNSSIEQTANSITSSVSQSIGTISTDLQGQIGDLNRDYESLQTTVESNWEQTATQSQITLLNNLINSTESGLQSQISSIISYVKYAQEQVENPITQTTSTVGVVTIGMQDNPVQLKLANDIFYFEIGGEKVAYIGTDSQGKSKLYIVNAELLTQLQIGNFAFIPRSNGSLSFRKVG